MAWAKSLKGPHTAGHSVQDLLRLCGHISLAALITAAVPFSSAASAPDPNLRGHAVKPLVSGKTAEGRMFKKGGGILTATASPITFRTYFGADGKVIEKSNSERGNVAAHGEWSAIKNKLCITFSDSYDFRGKKICWKVFSRGDGKYELYRKGELKREWNRIVSGNPHGLK